MKKIICELRICTNIENTNLYKQGVLENTNNRIQQYVNGLKKFFDFNQKNIDENKLDVYITDNTVANPELLHKEILNVIPKECRIITCINNNYGCYNKGAGDIEQWLYCKDLIKEYEYFIHFEPRQILKTNNFIDDVVNNLRTLLTIGKEQNHFNTGLFCIKTTELFNIIKKYTPEVLIKNSIGIEYAMYNFIIENNISYDTREKMDIIWFPTNLNPIEM